MSRYVILIDVIQLSSNILFLEFLVIKFNLSKRSAINLIKPTGAYRGSVDDSGTSARHVPLPHQRRQHARLRLLCGRVLHDRLLLPHRSDRGVHGIRSSHQEDT